MSTMDLLNSTAEPYASLCLNRVLLMLTTDVYATKELVALLSVKLVQIIDISE